MSDSVNTPSKSYQSHEDDWQLASDLWGGTTAMIEAATRRAPKFPSESDESYRYRIGGAVLFNAFRRTIGMLAGKAFQRPIAKEADIPAKILPYLENVDREGTHLDLFARNTFEMGIRDGARFIFVDMPQKQGIPSVYDERRLLLRPYWVDVDARNLIGWRYVVVGGRRVLSQIRMRESRTADVPGDEFATVDVERVRVVDAAPRNPDGSFVPDAFTSYRVFEEIEDGRTKEKTWRVVEYGQMRPLTDIPLVPFLPRQTRFMEGEMVMRDLADLNVAHWRSDSDQRYILHKARVPIGVLTGFSEDDAKIGLVKVGPDNWLRATDPGARASYMEHSGAAIGAGAKDLEEIENRMRIMGLEFTVEKQLTATEYAGDQAASDSELAKMVRSLEDTIENALMFTALWEGVAVKDGESGELHGGSVKIATDYGISQADFQELQFLLNARTADQISQTTFLSEIKRRGKVGDEFDVEEEIARLKAEAELNPPFDSTPPPENMPPAPMGDAASGR